MKLHSLLKRLLLVAWLAPLPAGAAPLLNWSSTLDTGASTAERTKAIGTMTNGDVIVASQIASSTNAQIRVQRLAAATGTAVWTRDAGTASQADDAVDMVVDAATGNSYIAARAATAANGLDWLVFKVNGSDGALGWAASYTYGGSGNDEPRAIAFTADGNLAVAGMETVAGATRLRVAKLNASTGTSIWGYSSPTDATDASDVAGDASGNVIAVGRNGADAFVIKLSSAGASSWTQTYNGPGNGQDAWNALAVFSNGDIAAAGYVTGAVGGQNFEVARYPAAGGAPTWTREINGTANANDTAYDITIDGSGDAYAAGLLRDTTNGQTAYLAKITGTTGVVAWSATRNGSNPAAEATDTFFAVRLLGADVLALGTQANTRADILISRFVASSGAPQEDTIFNGAAGNDDTALNKNLLAVSGTTFVHGGDTENATPSTNGVVRSLSVPSNNANLSALAISSGPFSPAFVSTIYTGYAATVFNAITSLSVTATFAQANASAQVRVNGGAFSAVSSGSASGPLALNVGSNTVNVKVVAQDGITTNTYGLLVTRLTNLESWRQTYFPGSTATSGPGADLASPKNDGIQNLMKFAANLDPSKSDVMPGTFSKVGGTLSFSYTPSVGAVADGIGFAVEWSDTLDVGSWSSSSVNQGSIGAGGTLVTATLPASASGQRFVRLKVAR